MYVCKCCLVLKLTTGIGSSLAMSKSIVQMVGSSCKTRTYVPACSNTRYQYVGILTYGPPRHWTHRMEENQDQVLYSRYRYTHVDRPRTGPIRTGRSARSLMMGMKGKIRATCQQKVIPPEGTPQPPRRTTTRCQPMFCRLGYRPPYCSLYRGPLRYNLPESCLLFALFITN